MHIINGKKRYGTGMPSARGVEWKADGENAKEARKKFCENYDKIFPEKKPWYERRDDE